MYSHPPPVPLGFSSPYMQSPHHVPPVQSRHVGSYSLGITSPSVRHPHYDYPSIANMPLAQSRISAEGQYLSPGQSQQGGNPPLPPPGRQAQYANNVSTAPASGAQQARYINNTATGESESGQGQGLLQQQQQPTSSHQIQQSAGQQKLQASQSHQQLPSTGNAPGQPATQIDINEAANYENAGYRGNKGAFNSNVPNPYQKYSNDPAEQYFYEQNLINSRNRQGGRGLNSPIYAYDELEGDQRVRKPLDEEQEKKLQKLKNEKTKRELHIQELDYRIHILEQENHSLRNQMDQMRNDYKRLNQVYEEKYSHEIDRLRLENQDYENSNKQWANRFKDIEQKCDDLVSEKQDLDEENRRLGEKILKIQVLLHEQPIKNQVRYENSSNKYG